ncbi:MAG TPA: hypothetical protein VFQ23_06265 [Anaerolineales bacterium]|nr:hypothetical protein [Anaerolineales bacterium]
MRILIWMLLMGDWKLRRATMAEWMASITVENAAWTPSPVVLMMKP